MLLKDKIVIVSGVGPGLGVRLARRAADLGAGAVVLGDVVGSRTDDAAARIRADGHDCEILSVTTDITDIDQCTSLADMTVERFGRIDALINSAYLHGPWEPSGAATMAGWRQAMEVTLYGSMQMTQAVIPQMTRQTDGSIVMINTVATRRVNQLESAYAVSKGALATAVQYLAEDLGPLGIRVNSTYIGWMDGEPVRQYLEAESERQGITADALADEIGKQIPLRNEIPREEDCATASLFLASDYARAITGAHLDVNGGFFLGR
ncbi:MULTISPECIES: SDR family oxidoreductase [Microbacterium]|uniref:SDR family oxidoreductase n=1 Tax=Microbacterium TaxID=33882 RepID=UPI00300F90C5